MLEPTRDTRRPTQPEEPPSGNTVTPETRPGGSELPVTPPFESTASDIPGRYVDLQPHARGGLGEVYRGRDAELNRPVAVKRIQARHADNADARARFLLEAEVTARLEHPGVVPVYGLVEGPDGQPCYAMRFIQGESLNDAIAKYHSSGQSPSASEGDRRSPRWRSGSDRSFAFRQLLTRFIALCNTVAYAHSRGIIHPDLKPHNVMLGNYGETLLVDWGLARAVGRTEEVRAISEELTLMPSAESGSATRTGQAVGTPAFMSPEQAAGNWTAVGLASDVYSLGATLYVLLTGTSPFSGGWADIQQKIQRGDFPSPRQLCGAAVPAALNAVCLKAMAIRPAERYADAQALAADIEQWLADEPVSAFAEPFTVRVRRWVRKHPGSVATIAASVLVGLISLGVSTALIGGKNRDLEKANAGLDQANIQLRASNTQLDQAKTKLENALTREQAQRRLADDRFTLALDAFKQQVFDADSLLANRSGTQDLRKATMAKAIMGLKKLLSDAEKTAEGEHVRIWAHVALGDIYLHTDRRVEKAMGEYQVAFDIARRLADAEPNDAQAQRDLFATLVKIGEVQLKQKELQKALAHFQDALKISQRLADADPKDARAQRDLSISLLSIGDVLLKQGEVQKALAHHQDGLKIRGRLADANPTDAQALRDLSISYQRIGDVLLMHGEVQNALAQYQEGLKISRRLADADPTDTLAQRDLSVFCEKIGDGLQQQGQVQQARTHQQEGLKIRRRLADADPKDTQAQRDLAASCGGIGETLRQQGEWQKALTQLQEGLKICQRLADADPKDAPTQRDLASVYRRIGDVHLQQVEGQQALVQYQEELKIRQRLADADPKDVEAQRDLALSLVRVGFLHQQMMDFAEAAKWYEKMITLVRKHPDAKTLGLALKTAEQGLATCQRSEKAIADLDFVLKQPAAEMRVLLNVRLRFFVLKKDCPGIVTTAEAYAKLAETDDKRTYIAACAWSLASGVVKGDAKLREEYAGKALALLRKAPTGKGYFVASPAKLAAYMEQDKDLDPLREREDFKKLLAELEKK